MAVALPNWYLCQTKARDENRAKVNLERQGYRVNVPTLDSAPLFPGYIFVQVDHKPFSPINSTRGVLRLVRCGLSLVIVPDKYIVDVEEAEREIPEDCGPGSKVMITKGPFIYREAIVKAKKQDRIVVAMAMMNQEQELEFPLKDVVAA